MTDTLTATAGQSSLRPALWTLPVMLGIAGVAAQSFAYINHDVAWVLKSSGRLLDGGVFGRDIVAVNPPLIWWISALPMAASRILGVAPVTAFNLFMLVLLTFSLVVSERLLRPSVPMVQRIVLLCAAAMLMSFGAGRDFGQREHMAVVLTLPYLALVLSRARGETRDPRLACLVGAAAAVGFAFKPHFLAVPLLIETFLLFMTGFRRTLLRPEVAGAILVAMAYAGAILIFARPYLFESLPDISRVYWAFNKPDVDALLDKAFYPFALLIVAVLLLPARRWPADATLLTLAAIGFTAAALIQWKAYSYHLYPITVFAVLALIVMARSGWFHRTFATGVFGILALMAMQALQDNLPHGEKGQERHAMVSFVNAHTPVGGRFLALSTHPFPGFPTALHSHANWAAASNSRIFLPAVARLRSGADESPPELLAFAAAKEHQAMLRDMTPLPDLVLVDVKEKRHAIREIVFDFVAFYREDPAFDAMWAHYREVRGAPEGYRAYVLHKEAKP
jgi:hypothetical protein